jgi:hypothetical protein
MNVINLYAEDQAEDLESRNRAKLEIKIKEQ